MLEEKKELDQAVVNLFSFN